jgi:hypothetical protein
MLLALYFTFSRGGWIAFFAGLVAAIAVDHRRLQLLTTVFVLAPWPALAIWLGSRSQALTHARATLGEAARDGHGLAAITIGLMAAAALAILALDAFESGVRVSRRLQRAYAAAIAVLLSASLAVVFDRYGLPPTLARKAYRAFNVPPPQQQTNLNLHLFSFSGNGRSENWHTAWQETKAHPWLGSGAGTYDIYWFQHRRVPWTMHDAHNLYLETLAELGPIGLLLLVVVLAVPLVAATRARASPLAAAAFGGYIAYLLHAAVDWDWEMPAVTLAALFCGFALIAAARREERLRRLRPVTLGASLAAAMGLVALALLGLLGNSAVSASSRAARAENWATAASQARRAMDFAPWSSEPWRKLAEAQRGGGDSAASSASFRTALAKEPRDWTLWFELAGVSRGANRQRALALALRLNPLSPEIESFRTRKG